MSRRPRRVIRALGALLATVALGVAGSASVHAQTGAVVGTVYDSISAMPLVDAAVFLWETPHRGVSDSEGRFRIEGVPAGEYSILFFHTQLGEMGISPGPQPIRVLEDGTPTEIYLATPSMRTVVASGCLMEERPPNTGIVAGWVRDADSDMRLSGSSVRLSWDIEGSVVTETLPLKASVSGWYYTCAAPANTPLLAAASFYGREGVRREVSVEADGYTEAAFTLYPTRTSEIRGRVRDGVTGDNVQGAEVWLRGTDRRTLTNRRGEFSLEDVLPGRYMMMTDHLAYGAKMDTLEVPGGTRLLVDMLVDTRPVEIAPITVTVDAREPISAGMAGGIRITSEQIEGVRQRSRDASDIIRSLHIPGVLVRHRSNGTICVGYITGQVKMNQTGCVEMLIYINDVRATSPDMALRLPPDAIERMTIYKPLEAGNLFGLGGGNGVWMIYTKGN